jgi:prepilin-type N-terminal cleavage/methylation domain-containing protein
MTWWGIHLNLIRSDVAVEPWLNEELMMNTPKQVRGRRAFTLIELVAVMVVLAVLSGVAIPKYFNYADRANTSALQGVLGGVRTGIANYYSNSSITGTAAYPTFTQLTTLGTVMQEALPDDPYNKLNTVANITVLASATGRVVANPTTIGWNYYVDNTATPPVAYFWANDLSDTTVLDSAGAHVHANDL